MKITWELLHKINASHWIFDWYAGYAGDVEAGSVITALTADDSRLANWLLIRLMIRPDFITYKNYAAEISGIQAHFDEAQYNLPCGWEYAFTAVENIADAIYCRVIDTAYDNNDNQHKRDDDDDQRQYSNAERLIAHTAVESFRKKMIVYGLALITDLDGVKSALDEVKKIKEEEI